MNNDSRYYLDYNSTSPIVSEVLCYIGNSNQSFANPSSQHKSGRDANKMLNQSRAKLYELFSLGSSEFEILLHSGTTEATNIFLNLKRGDHLFTFGSDHSCITEKAKQLRTKGVECFELSVQSDGSIDTENTIAMINQNKTPNGDNWLVYTWVNNETGKVWPLEQAAKIKDQTNCKVFVDATQAPRKIANSFELSSKLDCYSWSAHKFGGLKGVGFSFYKKENQHRKFLPGGDQQSLRSGTLNLLGLKSLEIALGLVKKQDLSAIENLKKQIINLVQSHSHLNYIPNETVNTITFYHDTKAADLMLVKFDLAGYDVGSGSACSSGSKLPSKSLVSMGLEKWAKNSIRISLGPENLVHSDEIVNGLGRLIESL